MYMYSPGGGGEGTLKRMVFEGERGREGWGEREGGREGGGRGRERERERERMIPEQLHQ